MRPRTTYAQRLHVQRVPPREDAVTLRARHEQVVEGLRRQPQVGRPGVLQEQHRHPSRHSREQGRQGYAGLHAPAGRLSARKRRHVDGRLGLSYERGAGRARQHSAPDTERGAGTQGTAHARTVRPYHHACQHAAGTRQGKHALLDGNGLEAALRSVARRMPQYLRTGTAQQRTAARGVRDIRRTGRHAEHKMVSAGIQKPCGYQESVRRRPRRLHAAVPRPGFRQQRTGDLRRIHNGQSRHAMAQDKGRRTGHEE